MPAEINLAVLSFGGIASIIVFHIGRHGVGPDAAEHGARLRRRGPRVRAGRRARGAPVARLRGLYLALSTMAFGVFVSNMVFARSASGSSADSLPDHGLPGGNLLVPRRRSDPST